MLQGSFRLSRVAKHESNHCQMVRPLSRVKRHVVAQLSRSSAASVPRSSCSVCSARGISIVTQRAFGIIPIVVRHIPSTYMVRIIPMSTSTAFLQRNVRVSRGLIKTASSIPTRCGCVCGVLLMSWTKTLVGVDEAKIGRRVEWTVAKVMPKRGRISQQTPLPESCFSNGFTAKGDGALQRSSDGIL